MAEPAARSQTPNDRFRLEGFRKPPSDDRLPCRRCQRPLPARWMGCRGGHCPHCNHPYPHGDCSD